MASGSPSRRVTLICKWKKESLWASAGLTKGRSVLVKGPCTATIAAAGWSRNMIALSNSASREGPPLELHQSFR